MGLREDISAEVSEILNWRFTVSRQTEKVPEKADLTLGKTAMRIDTCVLYVDMRSSSTIAEGHRDTTAAKIYNAYLNAMVRIAKSHWGRVRSFNGDSILVVFDPDMPDLVCDMAVRTAMEMQWVSKKIIKPKIAARGYEADFQIGVGVTKGRLLVTKAGLRGDPNNSDLIWPCTPVNLAAKLGDAATTPYGIWIDDNVYAGLSEEWMFNTDEWKQEVNMWTLETEFPFAGGFIPVYKTEYYSTLD